MMPVYHRVIGYRVRTKKHAPDGHRRYVVMHKGHACETQTTMNGLWRTWAANKLLEDAQLPARIIIAGINAAFYDQGTVPAETRLLLAPYLARVCSPRRYQHAIEQAVTRHFLMCHLVKLGYGAREADEMAFDAAARIHAQRWAITVDPNLPKMHEAELLAAAVFEHEARTELADLDLPKVTLEARVHEHVAVAMEDHRGRYDRPRQRVAEQVPRLRVAVPDELTELAEEEEALAVLEQILPPRRQASEAGAQ